MIEIRKILDQTETIIENLINKKVNKKDILELKEQLYKKNNKIVEIEKLRRKLNESNKKIGKLIKENNKKELKTIKEKNIKIKETIKEKENILFNINEIVKEKTLMLPNLLDKEVPIGKDDSENIEIKKWGTIKKSKETIKSHYDIAKELDIIDFEKGVDMSGSRFVVYKKMGARLQRALQNFLLDNNNEYGFEEYQLPFLVKKETMTGTGQLPKFKDDAYYIEKDNLYLIPTSEVTLCNLYRNKVLEETDLPVKLTSYSQCFRQEAGSAGRDTRGIIRLHQFNKVELVTLSKPEESKKELLKMLDTATSILQKLKLPYRIVKLCSGDTGFAASITYDIEVWMHSQNKYVEISSCSNCTDFQSRRMNIKYKDNEKGKSLVHTLNGSSLAIDRLIAAILEYYYKNNEVEIPVVLSTYMNNKTKILK